MENKLSNIKERILYLIEIKKDTKEKIFSSIGMTYGSFKGSAKNSPLNSTAIENILSIYPDVEAKWLLTGKGEMMKKEEANLDEANDILIPYNRRCSSCDEKERLIKNLNERVDELKDTIFILKDKNELHSKLNCG